MWRQYMSGEDVCKIYIGSSRMLAAKTIYEPVQSPKLANLIHFLLRMGVVAWNFSKQRYAPSRVHRSGLPTRPPQSVYIYIYEMNLKPCYFLECFVHSLLCTIQCFISICLSKQEGIFDFSHFCNYIQMRT